MRHVKGEAEFLVGLRGCLGLSAARKTPPKGMNGGATGASAYAYACLYVREYVYMYVYVYVYGYGRVQVYVDVRAQVRVRVRVYARGVAFQPLSDHDR